MLIGYARVSFRALISIRSRVTSRPVTASISTGRGASLLNGPMATGKLAGNGPVLWLRMQQDHDLWHAARELADELRGIKQAAA